MMKKLTAAIASVLMTTPIIALSAVDVTAPVKAAKVDFEVDSMNIGRLIGWIQASCSFATSNSITPDFAKAVILDSLKDMEKKFGRDLAMAWGNIQYDKLPKCQQFWPVEYLGDTTAHISSGPSTLRRATLQNA